MAEQAFQAKAGVLQLVAAEDDDGGQFIVPRAWIAEPRLGRDERRASLRQPALLFAQAMLPVWIAQRTQRLEAGAGHRPIQGVAGDRFAQVRDGFSGPTAAQQGGPQRGPRAAPNRDEPEPPHRHRPIRRSTATTVSKDASGASTVWLAPRQRAGRRGSKRRAPTRR